jgi:hypothetical protein
VVLSSTRDQVPDHLQKYLPEFPNRVMREEHQLSGTAITKAPKPELAPAEVHVETPVAPKPVIPVPEAGEMPAVESKFFVSQAKPPSIGMTQPVSEATPVLSSAGEAVAEAGEGASRASRIAEVGGAVAPMVVGGVIGGVVSAAKGNSAKQVAKDTAYGAADGAFGITDSKIAHDPKQRMTDRVLAGGRSATAKIATVAGGASLVPGGQEMAPVAAVAGIANLGLGVLQDAAYWTHLANNPGTISQIGEALGQFDKVCAANGLAMAQQNGSLIAAAGKGALSGDYQKALTSGNRESAEIARAEYTSHLTNLMIHGKIPKETYEAVEKLAEKAFTESEKNGFRPPAPPSVVAKSTGPRTPGV